MNLPMSSGEDKPENVLNRFQAGSRKLIEDRVKKLEAFEVGKLS